MVALTDKVSSVERDFRQSLDSSVNREISLRDAVDASLEGLTRYCQEALEKMERAIVDCFLRRDVIWENQIKSLRLTRMPTSHRLQACSPAQQYQDQHSPSTSVTTATAKVKHPSSPDIYDIPPCVQPLSSAQSTSSVSPPSASLYARPSICVEFPAFGNASETADVFNFLEQAENYLDIRPLTSPELLGTLGSVLRGPALSWWEAEKGKVKDWKSFKQAFMAAFLPEDYLTEVEVNLRSRVQQPGERLRDFAYDYRALCLKWKPDISEEELVGRILLNINPKVSGCLRGTVNTVEQLVKRGSRVEKDCEDCLNLGPDTISQEPPSPKSDDEPCLAITNTKASADLPSDLSEMIQAQQEDPTILKLLSTDHPRSTLDPRVSFEYHQGALYRRGRTPGATKNSAEVARCGMVADGEKGPLALHENLQRLSATRNRQP
ncbi:activity-regulated cytoskeleton-associated protein-like [Clarias gariepinus]|uniref:activity-regulated cytoskeleton-associated protein-like n=1 Tax=Clarias gariepinus TaxID=13013 RepID=UPI00234DA1D1|nr:activity-regulated cytoskeleton-associated protein-like [Clarias gariepinus]